MSRAQWLDDLDFASGITRQVAAELDALARDLHAVGFVDLALRMERKSACLAGAVEALQRGIGAKVSEDMRIAQQSTDNMLKAAMGALKEHGR